jgi:hypothetical protein
MRSRRLSTNSPADIFEGKKSKQLIIVVKDEGW